LEVSRDAEPGVVSFCLLTQPDFRFDAARDFMKAISVDFSRLLTDSKDPYFTFCVLWEIVMGYLAYS
jgi:hypothetical protein